jgi:hypothetical protein
MTENNPSPHHERDPAESGTDRFHRRALLAFDFLNVSIVLLATAAHQIASEVGDTALPAYQPIDLVNKTAAVGSMLWLIGRAGLYTYCSFARRPREPKPPDPS